MTKNRNKGGSGAVSSTQDFVTKKKRQFYNPLHRNILLKPEELQEYFQGNEIECLECGVFYKALSSHLARSAHDLSKDDYCIKYGIPIGTALIAENTSIKMSYSAKDRTDEGFKERGLMAMAAGHAKMKLAMQEVAVAECPTCNKEVQTTKVTYLRHGGKIKCAECARLFKINATKKCQAKNAYTKTYSCGFCSNSFETKNPAQHSKVKKGVNVYCSPSCASKKGNMNRQARTFTKKCLECDNEFTRNYNHFVYCSRECYWKSEGSL